MDVPKGVTVMIDAGAVFKLRGANIDVGSSTQNIDRSLGAVQVLGTPSNTVYFTSYLNERIGVDTYANTTTPSPGDWGGLVFENDYDYADQATDPTRRVLEQEGIFLDYVNHANISYGGGKVTVNGVQAVYDPIHMIEARPTVSFNTITHSADAALSADPNSLLESEFHDSFGESLYTLDYDRVGPDIHGNTLLNNSLNALFLRVQTAAGAVAPGVAGHRPLRRRGHGVGDSPEPGHPGGRRRGGGGDGHLPADGRRRQQVGRSPTRSPSPTRLRSNTPTPSRTAISSPSATPTRASVSSSTC